jgi:argininosuccinate lyase
LASLCGLAPSYQRDLQETKASALSIVERSFPALVAFETAFAATSFGRERMAAAAESGFTVATDVADALIFHGETARSAHALVGAAVARAEREGRSLESSDFPSFEQGDSGAPFSARASIEAKRTIGSTHPSDVEAQIASLEAELAAFGRSA